MDRDARSPAISPAEQLQEIVAQVVPPSPWSTVWRVGRIGIGLIALAAILEGVMRATALPSWLFTIRLLLVFIGSLLVGAAVSLRPDLWKAWLVGAVGAALGILGLPAHWDSFRLVYGVMTAVAVVWTLGLLAPPRYRLPVLSAIILFHFTGIFFATTTPPPTPWVTEQVFLRVYNPYLQFLYLRNAYHFYSPQPGPASVLVFLLKTETGTDPQTGEKTYETKWVVLPRRPADIKDPLGLTYYRYLAITEQVAHGTPGLRANTDEAEEMRQRRRMVAHLIPIHPLDELDLQYQMMQPDVARYVLPSYASHVILEHTPDAKTAAKTTVKIYRLQHNTMPIDDFINWRKHPATISDPYHPMTYRPFFLGEFNVRGDLINPKEPMLYWLVPIYPRPGGVPPGSKHKREYIDFMSIHALDPLNLSIDEVDDPKFRDRVFDWDQLR
jgi:hypothetical protein